MLSNFLLNIYAYYKTSAVLSLDETALFSKWYLVQVLVAV